MCDLTSFNFYYKNVGLHTYNSNINAMGKTSEEIHSKMCIVIMSYNKLFFIPIPIYFPTISVYL